MSDLPFAELDSAIEAATPEARGALIVGLAARLARLGVGLVEPSRQAAPAAPAGLLTAAEAAVIAGTSERWLLRATRGLAFRRDLSRKQVRFDERGLRAWLAGRRRA